MKNVRLFWNQALRISAHKLTRYIIIAMTKNDDIDNVMQVEYTEQCSTTYAQECVTVQEKVCREPDLQLPPPTDNYGVPQVLTDINSNNSNLSSSESGIKCLSTRRI